MKSLEAKILIMILFFSAASSAMRLDVERHEVPLPVKDFEIDCSIFDSEAQCLNRNPEEVTLYSRSLDTPDKLKKYAEICRKFGPGFRFDSIVERSEVFEDKGIISSDLITRLTPFIECVRDK